MRSLRLGKANTRENIGYFSDRDRVLARRLNRLGKKNCGGSERVIAAVGGTLKATVLAVNEGARDDSSNALILAYKLCSESLADAVKLLKRHNADVSGYLKHAVSRGVYYESALLFCLLAVICYHGSTRIGAVAEKLSARYFTYLLKYLLGKAVREGRKRRGRDISCDLPMTDGSILAHRPLAHSRDCRGGRVGLSKEGKTFYISYSHRNKIGNRELARIINAF